MDINNLTLEQKVVLHLANKGYLTNGGDIQRALREFEYADRMITGNEIPGLRDEMEEADCTHEALTTDEIQEVFDNDNK